MATYGATPLTSRPTGLGVSTLGYGPIQRRPFYGGGPAQRRPSYFQSVQEINYQQNPLVPSIDPPPRYSLFGQPQPVPPVGVAPDSGQPTLSQSPQYLPGWIKRRGPDGREYWVPPATGALPAPPTPSYKTF